MTAEALTVEEARAAVIAVIGEQFQSPFDEPEQYADALIEAVRTARDAEWYEAGWIPQAAADFRELRERYKALVDAARAFDSFIQMVDSGMSVFPFDPEHPDSEAKVYDRVQRTLHAALEALGDAKPI